LTRVIGNTIKAKRKQPGKKDILNILNDMREDVQHRNSIRVTGEFNYDYSRDYFIDPNISVKDFIVFLNKRCSWPYKLGDTLVSRGGGVKSASDLGAYRLYDGDILNVSRKPSAAKNKHKPFLTASTIRKYRKHVKSMFEKGRTPVMVCDLDATVTGSHSKISDESIRAILEILGAGLPFYVLSGISKDRVDRQFIDPVKSYLEENELNMRILDGLVVASDSGTQIYQYDYVKNKYRWVYAVDMRSFLGEKKYSRMIGTLNRLIEKDLGIRQMLRKKGVMAEANDEWEKREIIDERTVSGSKMISQVSFMVLGKDATSAEKAKFERAGGRKIREEYKTVIETALKKAGIKVDAKVSGQSTIDITLPGITKAYGIDAIATRFNLSPADIIFFGDAFGKGENDEETIRVVNSVVNLGRHVDISLSEYNGRKELNFLQTNNFGPDGFNVLAGVTSKTARIKPAPRVLMSIDKDKELFSEVSADARKHALRTAVIAERIGRELRLSREDHELLKWAAYISDLERDISEKYPKVYNKFTKGFDRLPENERTEPVSTDLKRWINDYASKYNVPEDRIKTVKELMRDGRHFPAWELYISYAVLGKSYLDLDELKLARSIYSHGDDIIQKLLQRNIVCPPDIKLIVSCHHDYATLKSRLDIRKKWGDIDTPKMNRMKLIASILIVATVFDKGNYLTRRDRWLRKKNYDFNQIINDWLHDRFDKIEQIDEIRPLRILKSLLGERDPELLKMVAEARQTKELSKEDELFIADQHSKTRLLWATGNTEVRDVGPGSDGYEETGELLGAYVNKYVDSNEDSLSKMLGKDKDPILFRIPVEILHMIGDVNARSFLTALSPPGKTNVSVELFSVTRSSAINSKTYDGYGISEVSFKEESTRRNTLTFLMTGKNSIPENDIEIRELIDNMNPLETVLMPVVSYDKGRDLSGLIRSTVLGLNLMRIARDPDDPELIRDTLKSFAELCKNTVLNKFELTEEDLLSMAAGNINDLRHALAKLIRLMPITPIDTRELKAIYLHARKALLAA